MAKDVQSGDDYCVIGTRHGKVVIGIYGLDSEADVVAAGGLPAMIGTLVETGAKQLETWLAAGAKALENGLQGRRLALDSARAAHAPADHQGRRRLGLWRLIIQHALRPRSVPSFAGQRVRVV